MREKFLFYFLKIEGKLKILKSFFRFIDEEDDEHNEDDENI